MAGLRKESQEGIGSLRGEIAELRAESNKRLDQTNQRLERVEQGLLDLGQFMKSIALELT
jgi:hypothetical protein